MAKRRVEMMEENRAKLIAAARKAFAEKGYAGASMDELTADAGLTRGARGYWVAMTDHLTLAPLARGELC